MSTRTDKPREARTHFEVERFAGDAHARARAARDRAARTRSGPTSPRSGIRSRATASTGRATTSASSASSSTARASRCPCRWIGDAAGMATPTLPERGPGCAAPVDAVARPRTPTHGIGGCVGGRGGAVAPPRQPSGSLESRVGGKEGVRRPADRPRTKETAQNLRTLDGSLQTSRSERPRPCPRRADALAGSREPPRRLQRIQKGSPIGRSRSKRAAAGRSPLRPPDAPLASEDAPLHLRRARRHLHHRPAEDRGPAGAGPGVRAGPRLQGRHRPVRRDQEAGQGHRSRRSPRTAGMLVRERALAGRPADQLQHDPQADPAACTT